MMGKILIKIGEVVEVEDNFSKDPSGGLRIRAKLNIDKLKEKNGELIPWAFPLLPKALQVVPKEGEAVLVIADEAGEFASSQRYYIGPLISQPQYNTLCPVDKATTLLQMSKKNPLASIDFVPETKGSFPEAEDVALVGRGAEDVVLKYNNTSKISELNIRAGIRKEGEYVAETKEDYYANKDNFVGNIMFNNIDPAYIQLKYKSGIATGSKNAANSIINMVADRINIMSNKDEEIRHDIHDQDTLVKESEMDNIMNRLHQVPKGDDLVELLNIMIGAILHHEHPWAGMEQCGDKPGFIERLKNYGDTHKILSEYVRIS
jgi:hypothetical protein